MKARNAHAAGLNDTPPGEVGEFDEKNAAVAAWLSAGLLVAVEESKPSMSEKKKGA